MVNSPASIIFEIFYIIFYNTLNTLAIIFHLFLKLLYSLGYIIYIGGPLGLFLAFLILVPLIYFLIKFFFSGAKMLLIGGIILLLLFLLYIAFIF